MNLSQRAMQPRDIPECVEIVARHPAVARRYGPLIQHLGDAWKRLLDYEARIAVVIRDGEAPSGCACFCGISVFVNDDFLSEMKKPPHFWVGPELARRFLAGSPPLLTGKQLRERNSRGGLNVVCLDGCFRPEYEPYSEVHRYMMSGFIQEHRGYLLKEAISAQSWSPEHLDFILKTGGCLWDGAAGGYTSTVANDLAEIVSRPHLVGITREMESERGRVWAGSWVGALFDYRAPLLHLSASEQHMLLIALTGATDEELAPALGTSLPTVKKLWVSIYRRVEQRMPGLIAGEDRSDLSLNRRGREKRRRVLAYLRERPEELRPVSALMTRNSKPVASDS